jgi:enoyl-CoA hydratase/carnithine racemase
MSNLLTHTQNGVLTLTLNRVAKKNALTNAFYTELADAFEMSMADEQVKVLTLQGHETVFSAGNDIADFISHPPQDGEAPVFRFLRAISTYPKPVLAAVSGPAVGIGTTMLLHCDMVWAGNNALFSMPFVNLGLCPEAASSLLLPQRLGPARAAQMLLMGDSIDARTALNWGLVNDVLPPTEVNDYVHHQALRMATKPMRSLVETKRLLKQMNATKVAERMNQEAALFGVMLSEPPAQAAFADFMSKRTDPNP